MWWGWRAEGGTAFYLTYTSDVWIFVIGGYFVIKIWSFIFDFLGIGQMFKCLNKIVLVVESPCKSAPCWCPWDDLGRTILLWACPPHLTPTAPVSGAFATLIIRDAGCVSDFQTCGVSTDGHSTPVNLRITENMLSAVLATGLFS